jgi:hypothetical protein
VSEAYDISADGRFLFHFEGTSATAEESRLAGEDAPRHEIVVVQNWFEELKARVPVRAYR